MNKKQKIDLIRAIIKPDEDCDRWNDVRELLLNLLDDERHIVDEIPQILKLWSVKEEVDNFHRCLEDYIGSSACLKDGLIKAIEKNKEHIVPKIWYEGAPSGQNYLRLVKNAGDITLQLVDHNGHRLQTYLIIRSNITLNQQLYYLYENEKAGITLDENNRLKIQNMV